MKHKNKIKAVFKAVGRVFIILIGVALIILTTIDIGSKPPLMANRKRVMEPQGWSTKAVNNILYEKIESVSINEISLVNNGGNEQLTYYAHDEIYSSNDIYNYISFDLNILYNNEQAEFIGFFIDYSFDLNFYNDSLPDIYDDEYYYIYHDFKCVPYGESFTSDFDVMYNIYSNSDTLLFNNNSMASQNYFNFPIIKGDYLKIFLSNTISLSTYISLYKDMGYLDFFAYFYLSVFPLDAFTTLLFDAGYDTAIDNVANNPNGYGYYTEEQYQQNYENGYYVGFDGGFTSGYFEGIDAVESNPNDYNLYTQTQYEKQYNDGRNSVLQNPTNFGLYNQAQYNAFGNQKYYEGYTAGQASNGVVGLDWFKASVSVANEFLNIMILPNVTIGNILSGFIILIILKWVLDWFRG